MLDRRSRLLYEPSECEQLRLGVEAFGHDWVSILKHFEFHSERTPIDLKDKWRNLQIRAGILQTEKSFKRFLQLGAQNQVFINIYPRDAALKAAMRGQVRHNQNGRTESHSVQSLSHQIFMSDQSSVISR